MDSFEKMISAYQSGLRRQTHKIGYIQECKVNMTDSIALFTTLYTPLEGEAWPVIMIRYPYPHLQQFLDATAQLFTKYGYAVVVQQCRGTGASGGEWTPFLNERKDGLDTINWIIEQPWCNGQIGTYGHSYLTQVQWAIADVVPKQVKTMVLSGFTTERYRQNYMNGMFRHDIYTGWAIDNSGIPSKQSSSELFHKAIHTHPHIDMDKALYGKEMNWYRDWVSSVSSEEPYWSEGFWKQVSEVPRKMDIPVLMIDGWFDQHLDGMIRDYYKLPDEVRSKSRLIIGPWTHALTPAGDLSYPGNERNLFKEALEWFDHHLQQRDYLYQTGEVQTYVIGEGIWINRENILRTSDEFELHLTTDRKLIESDERNKEGAISYSYNPKHPISSHGGGALLRYLSGVPDAVPAGSMMQQEPNYRPDVISFISEPLNSDLQMIGSIKAQLYVSTDVEDTAFFINVMEITADNESYNIRDGITSLSYRNGSSKLQFYKPNDIVEIELELWPIAWTFKKGHRIRVDVQSSSFPAYHQHANIKGPWAEQTEYKIAQQTIYCGGKYRSHITIPVNK